MKAADLVRHRTHGWLALVLEIKESGPASGYFYPEFMWLDTGEIESCSSSLLEVISERG